MKQVRDGETQSPTREPRVLPTRTNAAVFCFWQHERLDIAGGGGRQEHPMKSIKRLLTRTSPFSACGRASLVHVTQLPVGSILRGRSIGQLDIALLKEI